MFENNRDLYSLTHNLTIEKLLNIAIVELENLLKIQNTISHPYLANIEPCNICNLKCVLCPSGGNYDKTMKRGKMTLDTFNKIIDEYGKYLTTLLLYNYGEPFLNKDLLKMVKIAHNKGIGVWLSTNFQIFNEVMALDVVTSGLERLIISVDGSTQEIYEKYRVGGSLEKLLNNIETLKSTKYLFNSNRPIIELQTVLMSHNKENIINIKRLADKYNIYHRIVPCSLMGSDKDEFLVDKTTNPYYQGKLKSCFWTYRWIVFDWDGEMYPCCSTSGAKGAKIKDNSKPKIRGIFKGRKTGVYCSKCYE